MKKIGIIFAMKEELEETKKMFHNIVVHMIYDLEIYECKKDNITIKSIQLKDKASYVEEVSPTIVDTNKIDMDLKMYEVGDYVEYKLNVSNTSDENYYSIQDARNDQKYHAIHPPYPSVSHRRYSWQYPYGK